MLRFDSTPANRFWDADGGLMAWPDMDESQQRAFVRWIESEAVLTEPSAQVPQGVTEVAR